MKEKSRRLEDLRMESGSNGPEGLARRFSSDFNSEEGEIDRHGTSHSSYGISEEKEKPKREKTVFWTYSFSPSLGEMGHVHRESDRALQVLRVRTANTLPPSPGFGPPVAQGRS